MQSRSSLRQHFEAKGEVTRRSRTWEEAAHSEKLGLLCERLPSGYANWFSVTQDKVWWVYVDASDGGCWSVNGVEVTGYCIPYDRDIVRNLYALAKPNGKSVQRT